MNTMRIIAVADTHTFHDDLKVWPPGDVFIHAGDLLRGGSLEQLRTVVPWLHSLPYRHKIVVAGNHDWCFVCEPEQAIALLGPDIIYLQDSGTTIEGVRFWGSPWQPAYNDWAFNLPRGPALAEKWGLIPEDTQVLITHGPPLGIGDNSGGMAGRQGCADLLSTVQRLRPVVHLFGHIHQDGGHWQLGETAFVNVTTWECERGPTLIELVKEEGVVRLLKVLAP
jgi:predicted phosphohydrolase